MRGSSFLLAIIALLFVLSVEQYKAARILGSPKEREWRNDEYLLLPSLQIKPPSPNGCTFVPGGGGKNCRGTIDQRNFAGGVVVAPPHRPPHPPLVASDVNLEQKVECDIAT